MVVYLFFLNKLYLKKISFMDENMNEKMFIKYTSLIILGKVVDKD